LQYAKIFKYNFPIKQKVFRFFPINSQPVRMFFWFLGQCAQIFKAREPRSNTLLEICTPDIRISGAYQSRYNKRISRQNWPYFNQMSDRFQQNTNKNIFWIYQNISQISVDSGQRAKTWKIAKYRQSSTESNSRISRTSIGYQGLLHTEYHELLPLELSKTGVVNE